MKKIFIKTCIISSLVASIAVPVLADIGDPGWYSSNITLPRRGAWSTIERSATGSVQQTGVKDAQYDVLARITNSGGTALSDYQTHDAKKNTSITHNTGASEGDTLRAQFKTSAVNYFTTTATLGWQP